MDPARGPDCAHEVKSDLAVSVHGSSLSSTAIAARTHACVLGAMQKCQGRRACVLVFVRTRRLEHSSSDARKSRIAGAGRLQAGLLRFLNVSSLSRTAAITRKGKRAKR